MSSTMTFKLDDKGRMELVKDNILKDIGVISPLSTKYNEASLNKSHSFKFKNLSLSIAPIPLLLGASNIGGSGVFWDAFMNYIFPYMMDIAKVFCAIKIAQAFYQERRGGRDEGTGVGAFVAYGKWYILFSILPWCVELLDQLGSKMLMDLRGS